MPNIIPIEEALHSCTQVVGIAVGNVFVPYALAMKWEGSWYYMDSLLRAGHKGRKLTFTPTHCCDLNLVEGSYIKQTEELEADA
jgi:hypothetical protein